VELATLKIVKKQQKVKPMVRTLAEQVIVITGASSGIGRLTALEAARHGAKIVAAARNTHALDSLVSEIEAYGGHAISVLTDVSQWDQVERLARAAVEAYGRIDTWVNNAGVTTYGTVDQMDVTEMAQVIQVNLIGVIYGCKAALPIMQMQGEGSLINLSSGLGQRSVPLQAAYCASKFGVYGFSESLRMELEHEAPGIHVSVLLPASMNTPLFSHALSKFGAKPRPILPVYDPKLVAEAILRAAEHPIRDIYVGDFSKLAAIAQHINPRFLDWLMTQNGRFFKMQNSGQPIENAPNLFESTSEDGQTHGEWNPALQGSVYTQTFELHPERKPMLWGGLAALLGIFRGGRSNGRNGHHNGHAIAPIHDMPFEKVP
jgi:short-subunit dehydrogenase